MIILHWYILSVSWRYRGAEHVIIERKMLIIYLLATFATVRDELARTLFRKLKESFGNAVLDYPCFSTSEVICSLLCRTTAPLSTLLIWFTHIKVQRRVLFHTRHISLLRRITVV